MAEVALSLATHACIHVLSDAIIPPTPLLSASQRLYLCQKPSAILNALVVSLPPLYQFLCQRPFDKETLNTFPPSIELSFDRHLGFTLYDLMLMAMHREHPSVYAHHILGVAGILLIKSYRKAVVFPALFLPSELTVVVSSVLWIIQTLKIKTRHLHTLYKIRCLIFVMLRLTPGILCFLYPILAIARREGTKLRDAFARFISEFDNLETVVKVGVAVNVTAFTSLNIYWTILTFKALSRSTALIHHI